MHQGQNEPINDRLPVVLLGGTGDVGARLAGLLVKNTNLNVIIASRTGSASFSETEAMKQIKLDVGSESAIAEIPLGATVVNLTEATPPSFVERLLQNNCLFLDCSATPEYVDSLENVMTRNRSGNGIICVGTAPGLSTLMANTVAQYTDVSTLHIGIQLGMGRHFGKAATTWFYKSLGQPFSISPDMYAQPGKIKRTFSFGEPPKSLPAIGIGFPKQGVVADIGHFAAIQSYLAIDPPYMTRLVSIMLSAGLGSTLQRYAEKLAEITLRLPNMGGNGTKISVVGLNAQAKIVRELNFQGGDQADITAAVLLCTLVKARQNDCTTNSASTITDHLSLPEALTGIRKLLPKMDIKCW